MADAGLLLAVGGGLIVRSARHAIFGAPNACVAPPILNLHWPPPSAVLRLPASSATAAAWVAGALAAKLALHLARKIAVRYRRKPAFRVRRVGRARVELQHGSPRSKGFDVIGTPRRLAKEAVTALLQRQATAVVVVNAP